MVLYDDSVEENILYCLFKIQTFIGE